MAELLGRPDYRQPACERGLLWCPGWAPWSHTDFTNDIVLVRLAGRPLPTTRKIAPISVGSHLLSPGSFFVRSLPNEHIKRTVSQDFRPLFFWSINSLWAPHKQAKTVSRYFSFSRRYPRRMCIRIVVDYADMMSA